MHIARDPRPVIVVRARTRIAGLLVILALLAPAAAWSKQQVTLPIGSNYLPMRRAMIAAGYRAYRVAPRGASDSFVNQPAVGTGSLRSVYPELASCNGTGWNFCTFIFKRGKSDIVEIVTTGELPDSLIIKTITALSPQSAEAEYNVGYAADDLP
jgi:hypothetical protein